MSSTGSLRVGIVDLGGNTARLLVAGLGPWGLERIVQERVVLGLGAEIERRGRISKSKLKEAAETVSALHARARDAGCDQVEVLVTSPGRQSADRLSLERALVTGAPKRVRFVTPHEEARLAYAGALAFTSVDGGRLAVCDIGGGSTEIAVGSTSPLPDWCRSFDVGSLRLTQRHFRSLPPTKREIGKACAAVRETLISPPPLPWGLTRALASGGSARALRKLVGPILGADELGEALAISAVMAPRKIARRFDLPVWRAEVLAGGTIVLKEIQALLGVQLEVAAGGLREGAALALLLPAAAAA
jgi:exopolyphosphatase/guanosine-5'-triphosphate,3'-diphosphate pyrophosphatase